MQNDVARWRDTASTELQAAVEAAARQLEADEAYEAAGPKVSETLRSLDRLEVVAYELALELKRLSAVGRGALYQVSRLQRAEIQVDGRLVGLVPELGRFQVDNAMGLAANIAVCSASAKSFLVVEHMSDGPTEQGAGSNRGKECDLRAVSYADKLEMVPFRQPKDRFAVRVIEALVRASHPAGAQNQRDSLSLLKEFLDSVWLDLDRGPAPSWTRVAKCRRRIADHVRAGIKDREKQASRRARWNSPSSE
jgi:hypothetical protein